MAKSVKSTGKNSWALFLLLLAGIVIGGFLSHLAAGISAISWLDYGQRFGMTSPLKLDLGVIVLQFAISIKITIGSIVGIIIAAVIYKFL